MSRNSYKNFLRLFEKWAVDASKQKTGRDLGTYIRSEVAKNYHQGSATTVNERECNRIVNSLSRLASNKYFERYPRTRISTATGLTKDQLSTANSDDIREQLIVKTRDYEE